MVANRNFFGTMLAGIDQESENELEGLSVAITRKEHVC